MEALLEYGYIGLFIGSFLAATVVPFSSDVLVVGMLAMGGNATTTIIVATIGNWLGGLTSYWIGWLGKTEWLERWFRVKRETIEKYKASVARWGAWLALLTWLPFVGDVFAIVLGFFKARFLPSALWMLVGKGGRFVVWAVLYFYADLFTADLVERFNNDCVVDGSDAAGAAGPGQLDNFFFSDNAERKGHHNYQNERHEFLHNGNPPLKFITTVIFTAITLETD